MGPEVVRCNGAVSGQPILDDRERGRAGRPADYEGKHIFGCSSALQRAQPYIVLTVLPIFLPQYCRRTSFGVPIMHAAYFT